MIQPDPNTAWQDWENQSVFEEDEDEETTMDCTEAFASGWEVLEL